MQRPIRNSTAKAAKSYAKVAEENSSLRPFANYLRALCVRVIIYFAALTASAGSRCRLAPIRRDLFAALTSRPVPSG